MSDIEKIQKTDETSEDDSSKLVTKKKVPIWLFIVIGVVVLALVVTIVIIIVVGTDGGKADRKINAAEKYLSELDYESAIASYRDAIEIDPACLEAYMGLTDVYMTLANELVGKAAKYADEGKTKEALKAYEEAIAYYEEALDVIDDAIENVNIEDQDEAKAKKEEIEKKLNEIEEEKQQINDEDNQGGGLESEEQDESDGEAVNADHSATDDFTNSYVGGYVTFGVYEQDGDLSNGPEPIEWEVLDINENGMLLVSRYVLDCVPYNIIDTGVTWQTCTLRKWINNDFYTAAFDAREQTRINTTYVVNNDNSYSGTEGGDDTNDKVFCLSVDEILKYYQFELWTGDNQVGFSQRTITEATPYAVYNGVYISQITNDNYMVFESYGYSIEVVGKTGAWWWLRTPGKESCFACCVFSDGLAGPDCYDYASNVLHGVRPAIYVQQ